MTVLIGMHLGTHTVVIADTRSSRDGNVINDSTEKLRVSSNHVAVMAGSHHFGEAGLSFLKDQTVSDTADVSALSDMVLTEVRDPFFNGKIKQQRTMFMIAATADEKAKLFFLELDDLPNGGRVKDQREMVVGDVEFGIPAGLTQDEGQDLRYEVAGILGGFMESKARSLNPDNTKGITELIFSVGKVLSRLAETTPSISSIFHVGIKSSSGLTIQGEINFKKRRVVNLNQRLEKRWEYEVDGYAP